MKDEIAGVKDDNKEIQGLIVNFVLMNKVQQALRVPSPATRDVKPAAGGQVQVLTSPDELFGKRTKKVSRAPAALPKRLDDAMEGL